MYPASRQLIDTTLHTPSRSAPSFILIVLDTLRRDHSSLYGYARRTTPHIDRWAREALVFEDASSTCSWTLPNHASMFTGLFPRAHGAHGYRRPEVHSEAVTSAPLDERHVTLAEVLSDAEWETAAIAANHGFPGRRFHLDQGFGNYWAPAPQNGITLAPSDWLAKRLTPWHYM